MMKELNILIMAALLGLALSGCKSTPPKEVCETPNTKKLESAFSTSKNTLSNRQCWNTFEMQFDELLNIAEGAPGKENKKKFRDFLRWSEQKGIVSQLQYKKMYTEYFTPLYVSLPRNESSCRAGQNVTQITRNMDNELVNKKRGLLNALGDTQAYSKAVTDRQNIALVLLAAGEACNVMN